MILGGLDKTQAESASLLDRPLIYAGGGVRSAGAVQELADLAHKANIAPVAGGPIAANLGIRFVFAGGSVFFLLTAACIHLAMRHYKEI